MQVVQREVRIRLESLIHHIDICKKIAKGMDETEISKLVVDQVGRLNIRNVDKKK